MSDAPDQAPVSRPAPPPAAPRAPRLIATVGLHGSASTWVYNVVRELMIAGLGADRVVALFSDAAAGITAHPEAAGRHLVVKAHQDGEGLQAILWLTRAPIILSIRDPRDAVLSMVQRFGAPFEIAARAVLADCRFVHRCADAGHPVLRYEDNFVADRSLPARIAEGLGLSVEETVCDEIFERYRTDSVRAFMRTIPALSADRIAAGPGTTKDRVTEIHATHIGDGRVGKWRKGLTEAQQAQATTSFAPFLKRFAYGP